MIKKILVFLLLVSACCINLVPRQIASANAVSSSASGMCVIDSASKRILYEHNKDKKLEMASTTKVVTAITVLDNCKNLEEKIKVDNKAIGIEGTSIYLRKDEVISVKDLLYGLMLRSGNDAATALAIHVGGSVDGFADLMNKTAKKVGAKNSNFKNPHGLHHAEHYTTAYDLAIITAYALNNPLFEQIVSTKHYTISATNASEKRYLTNKNKLLSTLEGCCGVKTGYTKNAGRCLVSACNRKDFKAVCVVLNCGPMFEESAQLLNSAYNEYNYAKIIDKNKEIYNEYMIDETNGKLYLYTNEDFYYPLKDNEFSKLKLKYQLDLDDAVEGEVVGQIQVYLYNCLIKTLKLYTMNKIDKLIDSNTLHIAEIMWEEVA